MKASPMFKKASYIKLIMKEDAPQLHQSKLEELALDLKFTRCAKTMAKSIGFVHPIEDHLTENGISYVVDDWFLFTVQTESRKVSASEVNFEVQMIARDIEKNEHRKLKGAEKREIKEKLYAEKLKDAPSSFSRINFAFNKEGDMIVSSSSDKPIESLMELFFKAFSDYFSQSTFGYAQSMPIAATTMFSEENPQIPENVNLEIGSKGEGKNGGKKFTFNDIDSDDQNIVSMVNTHALTINKLELYMAYLGRYAKFYTSNKGIEKIDITEELQDALYQKFEDSQMESEEDFQIGFTLEMVCQFYQELFAYIKKLYPESGKFEGIIFKKFTSEEELKEFTAQ